MKAFKLNMHFKLPDDFKGDLNDAIEEMLKYRRLKDKGHSTVYQYNKDIDQYENFMDMINTTDRVLLAETWIATYDKAENKWKYESTLEIKE